MTRTPIRIVAAALVVAAALSGAALGASGRAPAASGNTLESFGSTTPAVSRAVYKAPPLYRERTVRTAYHLQRVACASGESSTACFVAR